MDVRQNDVSPVGRGTMNSIVPKTSPSSISEWLDQNQPLTAISQDGVLTRGYQIPNLGLPQRQTELVNRLRWMAMNIQTRKQFVGLGVYLDTYPLRKIYLMNVLNGVNDITRSPAKSVLDSIGSLLGSIREMQGWNLTLEVKKSNINMQHIAEWIRTQDSIQPQSHSYSHPIRKLVFHTFDSHLLNALITRNDILGLEFGTTCPAITERTAEQIYTCMMYPCTLSVHQPHFHVLFNMMNPHILVQLSLCFSNDNYPHDDDFDMNGYMTFCILLPQCVNLETLVCICFLIVFLSLIYLFF